MAGGSARTTKYITTASRPWRVKHLVQRRDVARPTWPSSRRRSATMPLCIQRRRARARAPSASGRPRSRGGGRAGPSRRRGCRAARPAALSAIAEHSMCQPGRPAPQGAPRRVLARLVRLPEREVERVLLALGALDALALVHLVDARCESAPYPPSRAHAEVDVAAARVGVAGRRPAPRSSRRSPPIVSRASGSWSGRPSPSASVSAHVGGRHLGGELGAASPRPRAAA